LHQVGDLFELNVKLRCQKVKRIPIFALQYIARENHLLENYNELEERHHRINKWKYETTKT